jgi:hypothetical protein
MSQQAVSAGIIQNSAAGNYSKTLGAKTKAVLISWLPHKFGSLKI